MASPEQQENQPFLAAQKYITAEHLQMLSQTTGGFRFREDPSLPPARAGYTNKKTKTIYYNPLIFLGSEEHGIKPLPNPAGFFYHEAGHHVEEVLALDNRIISDLPNIEIPESYQTSKQAQERFIHAVNSNLGNTVADIWLESFLSRRPYYAIRQRIRDFNLGLGEMTAEQAQMLSKPQQLLQALLGSRYSTPRNLNQILDQDVYESYTKIIRSGAVRVLMDASVFENYFASPYDHDYSLARKFRAYREILLPEYLKLMEAELEDRKQHEQQAKGGLGATGDDSVPLTDGEIGDLVGEILKELEASGHQSQTPSQEEQELRAKIDKKIKSVIDKPDKKQDQEQKEPHRGKSGLEAIEQTARQLEREDLQKKHIGLAEALQIRERSIDAWEKIKEKYAAEITATASFLSEIFLDDRRKRLEFLRREGEIVPGLEYETIAAFIKGELDPETRMIEVRNPEFIETEVEWVVDTSGSMSGPYIEKSIDLLVIVSEAFKKVKEDLEAESLVMLDEDPLRIGVTKFTTVAQRVTKLSEPISDEKELRIIDEVSQVGGGTDEVEAIEEVYRELTLGKKNVIKLMFILSDGHGNEEGVTPVISQVEEDDQIIFMAIGLGSSHDDSQAIVDTYIKPLRKGEDQTNVFGFATENPEEILPHVLDFIKKQVEQRKRSIVY